jgi:hypothetical protein
MEGKNEMNKPWCANCKRFTEAIAYVDGVGVVMHEDGQPTGMCADGTTESSTEQIEAANMESEVFCAECKQRCEWRTANYDDPLSEYHIVENSTTPGIPDQKTTIYYLTPHHDLSQEDMEDLCGAVEGSFPHVYGEWLTEEWMLWQSPSSTDSAFKRELRYIALWNKPGGAKMDEILNLKR